MRILDLIFLAWSALKDRKVRTILTILGIVVGPAIIVSLNATTSGLTSAITGRLQTIGSNTIYLIAVGDFNLNDREISRIGKLNGVSEVIPFYQIASGEVRLSGKKIELNPFQSYLILSLDLRKLDKIFPGLDVEEGEIVYAGDNAYVGYRVANPTDPNLPNIDVGDLITVSRRLPEGGVVSKPLKVRGIFEKYGQTLFLNPDIIIFVNERVGKVLVGGRSYSGAFIKLVDAGYSEIVVEKLLDTYGADVRVFSLKAIQQTIQDILTSLQVFFSAIGAMSVLVAFFGIMTTMFTSVTERTREIGLIKALGFKTHHVLLTFLMEAVLIGLIGGILGSFFGAVGSFFLVDFFGRPPSGRSRPGAFSAPGPTAEPIVFSPNLTPELLLLGVAMAVIVSILAGLIPAYRAAKLEPIEALRRE